jgi:uncharacterized repeat protein (TIGR01451 family)
MNRLIAILFALFALACANPASAQTTLETFESAANTTGNTSFTSGGTVFDIVSYNATNSQLVFHIEAAYPGTGWSGTANDNKYIDNAVSGNNPWIGGSPDFSIKSHDGSPFTVGSFWLYLNAWSNDGTYLGKNGNLTVKGKLSGNLVFTAGPVSSGFGTSLLVDNGFGRIDLATFGGADNTGKIINEIEIVGGGNFQYIALDAWTWSKVAGYTVGTAVTPVGAGTLVCTPTSVSPGGTSSCSVTATTSGYELNNISGCGGITSTTSPFTTGTINANCTVTATFVNALSASTTKTDVSCNGGSNGAASVIASNGVSPYTYSWSPAGGTSASATGLVAGTYTVTVTDNRNIQVQKSATINQPSVLALNPASIPDGLVNWPYAQGFSASGGTSGYAYAVTSGAVPGLSISGSILSGTPSTANNYNVGVTVTDANSCQTTKNYPMQVRATMGLLSVGDGAGFAAYGQPVDYTVSLSNATAFTVSGIQVTATLSAALDAGTATWQCLSNGSNGVVCNGASNSGLLSDTSVTIPAGQTAKWNIHATIFAAPAAGSADVNASASYATPATDSDTLVIFRGGFE